MVRESIPKPWDNMDSVLIKYVTLEGRYEILLTSHILLLNHFISLEKDKVNFPFFIFNSLTIFIEKVKQERTLLSLHGDVIKLVVDRYLAMVYSMSVERELLKKNQRRLTHLESTTKRESPLTLAPT